MDTPDECRAIDFEDTYMALYGTYSNEDVYDENTHEEDEYTFLQEKRERIRQTRKKLGWH